MLAQLGGIRFLLSAGHVIESLKTRTLLAQAGHSLAPVTGDLTYLYGRADGNSSVDPFDIRMVRLSGVDWDSVPLTAFLSWNELDHAPPKPQRHTHAMLGFPSSKQRVVTNESVLRAP